MKCSDLYKFRRIAEAALSPHGDTLAYVVRSANADNDCYENELYITQLVSEEGRALASVRLGVELCGPAWSREGHSLAAIAQPSEDADDRIVLYSSDGGLYRSFDVSWRHITDRHAQKASGLVSRGIHLEQAQARNRTSTSLVSKSDDTGGQTSPQSFRSPKVTTAKVPVSFLLWSWSMNRWSRRLEGYETPR